MEPGNLDGRDRSRGRHSGLNLEGNRLLPQYRLRPPAKSPTLRQITNGAGVTTRKLFSLFQRGPAKKVAKISGSGKFRWLRLAHSSSTLRERVELLTAAVLLSKPKETDFRTTTDIAFICSCSLDMAYPALLMGWAALGKWAGRYHLLLRSGAWTSSTNTASIIWRSAPPVAKHQHEDVDDGCQGSQSWYP